MTTMTFPRYSRFGFPIGQGCVVAGLCLVACGGSNPQPNGNPLDDTSGDTIAGGETSEFGGSSPYCQPASATPLDLDADDLAPWVARVEGHHELGFAWQRQFLSDAITGFEEQTQIALDVSVLGAYAVELDAFCGRGRRSLHLELEIALATADGALAGLFRHRVGTAPGTAPELGEPLSTFPVPPYVQPSLDDFSGSLDYGVDLELQARRQFSAQLVFDGSSLIGSISTFLSPGTGEDVAAGWTPITGAFPDDGCASSAGRPLDLDAPLSGFAAATPRALLERALAFWQRGPLPAQRAGGNDTSVQLSAAGAPRACQGMGQLTFGAVALHVPVRLETSDGSLALEHTALFTFLPGDTPVDVRSWPRRWIPVEEFEQTTGIPGVRFGSSEYGSVDFLSTFDFTTDTTTGALYVNGWENMDSRDAGFALTW
jgi:hypothetical protein